MTRPFHGSELRGLSAVSRSPSFEGRFGRMFRNLPPLLPDDKDLEALARQMVEPEPTGEEDTAGDNPDIPAGFTYFGQFVDHDLTFDPTSQLERDNDPTALVDFRTPRFDLDSVYGRGPADQPYLYDDDGKAFLLGDVLTGNALTVPLNAHDLPRSRAKEANPAAQARAIIGDPRNDENVIVSQLQGLVLRLHNGLAASHPDLSFEQVQREVRFHYQWLVLNDFLPTIVSHDVLNKVLPHRERNSNTRLD